MKKQIYKLERLGGVIEIHRRILPGVHLGTNNYQRKTWVLLVKLPFGYGMNIGTGFSGFFSVRSWDWAKYDYADHFLLKGFHRWMRWPDAHKH